MALTEDNLFLERLLKDWKRGRGYRYDSFRLAALQKGPLCIIILPIYNIPHKPIIKPKYYDEGLTVAVTKPWLDSLSPEELANFAKIRISGNMTIRYIDDAK